MINQPDLLSLKTNDKVEHFLLLSAFNLKNTKTGKQYLDMSLRDKSAEFNAKMWSNFESFAEQAKVGAVVKVLGSIDEFNNQPQIKVEKIRLVSEKDDVSPIDFLPKSKRPLSEMETELANRINKLENPTLRLLIEKIFDKNNFSKFKEVPAGKAWHHAYIGGLLEHTLEIMKICDLMCDIHEEINRDLLICGAILHDLGKIEELKVETGFDYTDKGKLIGHIVIAANIIDKESEKIKDFPAELKDQLIHLVLSHQGKLEYASPVVPRTLESIVLYHADELSAKTNAYKGAILSELEVRDKWTKFLPLAGTSIYIPDSFGNKDEFKDSLF